MKRRAILCSVALALVSVAVLVPASARVLVVPEGQSFLVKQGNTAQITGRSDEPKLRSVRLLVDNKMVYEQQRSGPYSLQWMVRQATVGTHRVQVIGHCIDADRLLATMWAHVFADEPAVIASPASDKLLIGEERVVLRVDRSARVTGAKLLVDDIQMAENASQELALDTKALDSGEHTMKVLLQTDLGLAETPPVVIQVGKRISLTASSVENPIRLDAGMMKVTVTPQVPEGFKWQMLQVFCDQAKVGESAAPDSKVVCDMTNTAAGQHQISVVVTDASGLTFESNVLDVSVERAGGIAVPGDRSEPRPEVTASPLGRAIASVAIESTANFTYGNVFKNPQDPPPDIPPLLLSAWRGLTDEVQAGLNADTKLLTDGGRFGIVHYAVASQNADLVRLVLKAGASAQASAADAMTPLHLAVLQGTKDIATLLIQGFASAKKVWAGRSAPFGTPLMLAVAQGHTPMAAMLARHANPMECDSSGLAPIHQTVILSNEEMVKTLVSQGADANAPDRDGMRPIHHAVLLSDEQMVRALVALGADIDAIGKKYNAILMAVLAADLEMTETLIVLGADFKSADSNKRTLLWWAACGPSTGIVHLLMKYGASPNVAEKGTLNTPLHVAAVNGHIAMIACLVQGGANMKAKNSSGRTPFQSALLCDQYEAAALLKRLGGG